MRVLLWLLITTACITPAGCADGVTGTAFAVSEDGYLVTCAHVVRGNVAVLVQVAGKHHDARVVGVDDKRDLALLEAKDARLPALALGDSNTVQVGQDAHVYGFPLAPDLGSTLKATRGTIAGVLLREGQRVIQTDCPVNPGNSGGPLTDDRGAVVGVVSAKLVSLAVEGVGFAVPINYAKALLDDHGVAYKTEVSVEHPSGPELAKRVCASVALVVTRPKPIVMAIPDPPVRWLTTECRVPTREPFTVDPFGPFLRPNVVLPSLTVNIGRASLTRVQDEAALAPKTFWANPLGVLKFNRAQRGTRLQVSCYFQPRRIAIVASDEAAEVAETVLGRWGHETVRGAEVSAQVQEALRAKDRPEVVMARLAEQLKCRQMLVLDTGVRDGSNWVGVTVTAAVYDLTKAGDPVIRGTKAATRDRPPIKDILGSRKADRQSIIRECLTKILLGTE